MNRGTWRQQRWKKVPDIVRVYEDRREWLRLARQLESQRHELADIWGNQDIARVRLHEQSNVFLLSHLRFQHDLSAAAAW